MCAHKVHVVACFAPLFSRYNNHINVALFEPVSSAFPSFDGASVSAVLVSPSLPTTHHLLLLFSSRFGHAE